MTPHELLALLHTAEKLKDTTRHCDTSGGRRESVAEHSWRLTLMAFFLRSEFPHLDMDKVMRMCLVHDLGECFTGDIPSFLKTDSDTAREDALLSRWVSTLPAPYNTELAALYAEMDALDTEEAKLYKALDKLEAVIQHNEAALSETIDEVKHSENHGLKILGILLTRYNVRTKLGKEARETLEQIASHMKTEVFRTTIRQSVQVEVSQTQQTSLFDLAPKAAVTQDYAHFVDEVEEKLT